MNYLKRFWSFLKEDTWQSWIVSLVLLVIIIRFIFFPLLSLVTQSPLPLVVVESCSLYHSTNFDDWWLDNGDWYKNKEITKKEFESFQFKNGLNKGDIIFVWGRSKPKIGDIIIFQPNPEALSPHPIIHRVVGTNPYSTKGDHNFAQLMLGNNNKKIDETSIPDDKIIGKAVFKIPLLGWVKLVFFEPFRDPQERGFCS